MKGVIEGKRAREYEKRNKEHYRDKIFEDFLLKNVKNDKEIKVCDFCCGPGNTIEVLKRKFKKIVGIDASREMIRICNEKFHNQKNIKLICASVTNTKLPADYFDYVIIRMGLHHIKDKQKAMQEAYRILRKDGKCIVIDKYYLNLFELYFKGFIKLLFKWNPSIFQEYMVSKKAYDRLFLSSFQIQKEEYLPYDNNHVGIAFMYVLLKC